LSYIDEILANFKKEKWTNLTGQISPIGEILANFEISKILNIFDRVRFWLIFFKKTWVRFVR
jgi:hypothetical protein